MEYTAKELYKELTGKLPEVYEVFKHFFGEQFVDLHYGMSFKELEIGLSYHQHEILAKDNGEKVYDINDNYLSDLHDCFDTKESSIIVWWPSVTVTNEYDKSVLIQDLYAKIPVNSEGKMPVESHGFMLNRSTYTKKQFSSNYMHSHISGITKNDLTKFMEPCLGKGPLVDTILSLKMNTYDEVLWMLFCDELSKYVTVESVSGIPYHRLESIGQYGISAGYCNYANVSLYSAPTLFISGSFRNKIKGLEVREIMKDFAKYYLTHGHLSICFHDGSYHCGMTYYNFIIDISNSFIDYFNKYLKSKYKPETWFSEYLLNRVLVSNNKFYDLRDSLVNTDYSCYEGKPVLTFKGKEIKLKILDDSTKDKSMETILLNNILSCYVLKNILSIINYRFNNEKQYSGWYRYRRDTAPTYAKVHYV